jgi:hypothetical protein
MLNELKILRWPRLNYVDSMTAGLLNFDRRVTFNLSVEGAQSNAGT